MKAIFTSVFFIIFTAAAFCGGSSELANTQEIDLSGVTDLRIIYSFEDVTFYKGNTNSLIIKEYMSEIDKRYFAVINKYGNTLTIENGQVPVRPIFKNFQRRLEVFLPVSYKNIINIKTSSGNIETPDIACSTLNIVTTSGDVSTNSINTNITHIKTTSGNVRTGKISGNADVITTSGGITCEVDLKAGDLIFNSTSGRVNLILPRNLQFRFSSKSASGKLTTPFSSVLSQAADDKNLTQGVVRDNAGGSGVIPLIDIATTSGDITVEWQ